MSKTLRASRRNTGEPSNNKIIDLATGEELSPITLDGNSQVEAEEFYTFNVYDDPDVLVHEAGQPLHITYKVPSDTNLTCPEGPCPVIIYRGQIFTCIVSPANHSIKIQFDSSRFQNPNGKTCTDTEVYNISNPRGANNTLPIGKSTPWAFRVKESQQCGLGSEQYTLSSMVANCDARMWVALNDGIHSLKLTAVGLDAVSGDPQSYTVWISKQTFSANGTLSSNQIEEYTPQGTIAQVYTRDPATEQHDGRPTNTSSIETTGLPDNLYVANTQQETTLSVTEGPNFPRTNAYASTYSDVLTPAKPGTDDFQNTTLAIASHLRVESSDDIPRANVYDVTPAKSAIPTYISIKGSRSTGLLKLQSELRYDASSNSSKVSSQFSLYMQDGNVGSGYTARIPNGEALSITGFGNVLDFIIFDQICSDNPNQICTSLAVMNTVNDKNHSPQESIAIIEDIGNRPQKNIDWNNLTQEKQGWKEIRGQGFPKPGNFTKLVASNLHYELESNPVYLYVSTPKNNQGYVLWAVDINSFPSGSVITLGKPSPAAVASFVLFGSDWAVDYGQNIKIIYPPQNTCLPPAKWCSKVLLGAWSSSTDELYGIDETRIAAMMHPNITTISDVEQIAEFLITDGPTDYYNPHVPSICRGFTRSLQTNSNGVIFGQCGNNNTLVEISLPTYGSTQQQSRSQSQHSYIPGDFSIECGNEPMHSNGGAHSTGGSGVAMSWQDKQDTGSWWSFIAGRFGFPGANAQQICVEEETGQPYLCGEKPTEKQVKVSDKATSFYQSIEHGISKGTSNLVGKALRQDGYSEETSQLVADTLYYSSYWFLRFMQHCQSDSEFAIEYDYRSLLAAGLAATLDVFNLYMLSLFFRDLSIGMQQVAKDVHKAGWEKTACVLEFFAPHVPKLRYGVDVLQTGFVPTALSVTIGSAAQRGIEYLGGYDDSQDKKSAPSKTAR